MEPYTRQWTATWGEQIQDREESWGGGGGLLSIYVASQDKGNGETPVTDSLIYQ